MYCWLDGVHFRILLEENRLCCLVMVGVTHSLTDEGWHYPNHLRRLSVNTLISLPGHSRRFDQATAAPLLPPGRRAALRRRTAARSCSESSLSVR